MARGNQKTIFCSTSKLYEIPMLLTTNKVLLQHSDTYSLTCCRTCLHATASGLSHDRDHMARKAGRPSDHPIEI